MTKGRLTAAIFGCCFALFAMMGANTALAKGNMPPPASFFKNNQAQTRYMMHLIKQEFSDQPKVAALMVSVAMCESGDPHEGIIRQWGTDGRLKPVHGHINDAAGSFQVRMNLWRTTYESLGLSPETSASDYVMFVHYLHHRYGLQPWEASKWCWKKYAK